MAEPTVVIYGDFNCPWSLLASRRASLLEADGVHVDWRAVEHDPGSTERPRDDAARFDALRVEAETVLEWLLPGERMPYALAGFATDTRAAIEGYAAAYHVGAASIARNVLFKAFWNHSVDLADHPVVHALLVDALHTARTPTGDLRGWDYPTSSANRPAGPSQLSVRRWAAEWQGLENPTLPVVVLDTMKQLPGKAAIEWLGRELLNRRLELDTEPGIPPQRGASDIDASVQARRRHDRFPVSEPQSGWPAATVAGHPAGHARGGRRHLNAVDDVRSVEPSGR